MLVATAANATAAMVMPKSLLRPWSNLLPVLFPGFVSFDVPRSNEPCMNDKIRDLLCCSSHKHMTISALQNQRDVPLLF